MLMNAKRARECSDKTAIDFFISSMNEAITNACLKGKYTATINWNVDLDEELKEKVVNEAYSKGYDVLAFSDTLSIYW